MKASTVLPDYLYYDNPYFNFFNLEVPDKLESLLFVVFDKPCENITCECFDDVIYEAWGIRYSEATREEACVFLRMLDKKIPGRFFPVILNCAFLERQKRIRAQKRWRKLIRTIRTEIRLRPDSPRLRNLQNHFYESAVNQLELK